MQLDCPSEIIDDLILILRKLLEIANHVKIQKKILAAEARARDAHAVAARHLEFEAICRQAYSRYQELEKARLRAPECVRRVSAEFGYQIYETKVHLQEGRRLFKEDRNARIREDHKNGKSQEDLQAQYQLTYSTIKKILMEGSNGD